MAKDFAKAFYKSARWRKCRASYIAHRITVDGGMCERCRKMPGYIVHHKVWLTPENISDPEIALCHSNLEYDCIDCHNRIEQGERVCIFDDEGQPVLLEG